VSVSFGPSGPSDLACRLQPPEATISKRNLEGLANLEASLKKHRPDFTDLLRNPVSCIEIRTFITMCFLLFYFVFLATKCRRQKLNRQVLKRSLSPCLERPQYHLKAFVDEAIIISDMFCLNE